MVRQIKINRIKKVSNLRRMGLTWMIPHRNGGRRIQQETDALFFFWRQGLK